LLDLRPVGTQFDARTSDLEGFSRGMDVTAAVVEHHDEGRCHGYRAPLVDGTPLTRASGLTAWRKARAKALNSASAMWWGSRPPSTVTCTVSAALNAIASNTWRTMEPVKCPPMRWYSKPAGSPECTRYGRPETSTTACTSASSRGT